MAKNPTESLTLDYTTLKKLPISIRLEIAKNEPSSLAALTPSQYSALFPKNAAPQLMDAVSGGMPSVTKAPKVASIDPNMPPPKQPRPKPDPSPAIKQKNFLDHLEGITGIKRNAFITANGTGIDRTKYKQELENNPEVAKRLFSLAKAEVGNQGTKAIQKWMETVFNRAYAQGRSVEQIIDPNNGYWPKKQRRPGLSDSETQSYSGILNRTLSGSNESNYATDNASAGLGKRRQASGRKGHWDSGEFFYTDHQYVKAMDRLRTETEKRQGPKTAKKDEEEEVEPIVAAGKAFKGIGLRVSEHPEFGGVKPVHAGRGHYEGRAFDLNVGTGMIEAKDKVFGPIFDKISNWAKANGYKVIWRSKGHNDHMHIEAPEGMGKRPHFTKSEIKQLLNSFTKEEKEAWNKKFGIDLDEYVKEETKDLQAADAGVKFPDYYDSLDENLKKYIEKLPPSEQKQIFEQFDNLKSKGQDPSEVYKKFVDAGTPPKEAATATVTAIANSPPGQMPEVNPAGFGVGMIHGEQKYTQEDEAKREGYTTGKIKFTGFDDEELSKVEIEAGSGGRKQEHPSIPSGTYSLSPQQTGSVISNYYRSGGIDPSSGAFSRVYNVGLPKTPTSVGYDPKVQRNRTQIQIHSNVSRDIDKLISSGCLTVSPDEYPKLVDNIERARKASKSGISLVVENNQDGTSSFNIMPTARATNPITVNTAVANFKKTGNMLGQAEQTPPQQFSPDQQVKVAHSLPVVNQTTPEQVTPVVNKVPTATPAAPEAPSQAEPTAAPLVDETGKIVPRLQAGGEVRTNNEGVTIQPGATSPAENATVLDASGKPLAEVNTSKESFDYNPRTGIIDVTPQNRTNPNDLVEQQKQINKNEIAQSDQQNQQQSYIPPTKAYPNDNPQNQNWAGLMGGLVESPLMYHNGSVERAFRQANFQSSGDSRFKHFGSSVTYLS